MLSCVHATYRCTLPNVCRSIQLQKFEMWSALKASGWFYSIFFFSFVLMFFIFTTFIRKCWRTWNEIIWWLYQMAHHSDSPNHQASINLNTCNWVLCVCACAVHAMREKKPISFVLSFSLCSVRLSSISFITWACWKLPPIKRSKWEAIQQRHYIAFLHALHGITSGFRLHCKCWVLGTCIRNKFLDTSSLHRCGVWRSEDGLKNCSYCNNHPFIGCLIA